MRFLLLLCSVASAFCADQRIVGGSVASISDYPHQLSLRISGSHACGASLISETRAVTAAHCIVVAIEDYTLLGGTTDRTVTNCANCRLFNLTAITKHPLFAELPIVGFHNDVAVLSFAAQTFNDDFQAISLARPSDGSFAEDRCTITGWGVEQSTDQVLPILLRKADMTVLPQLNCTLEWGPVKLDSGHICVRDPNSSACSGDSGGPLVCDNLLAGATSWGGETCSPDDSSVYTRISSYYYWIIAQ